MPQHVTIPGVGDAEFPDGMSADEIQSAIASNFSPPQQNPDAGFVPVDTENTPQTSQAQRNYEFELARKQRMMESGEWQRVGPVVRMMYEPTPPGESTASQLFTLGKNIPSLAGAGLGFFGKALKAGAGDVVGTGDTMEDVGRSISRGEPLPVEQAAAKVPGVAGIGARAGLGILETVPKLALLAAFPESLLAQSIAAGGIFGFDEQGGFSPKAAAIGALLPGAGHLAAAGVSRALVSAISGGARGLENRTVQWLLEEMGRQAALNAVMIAGDSPQLIDLYHQDPDAAKRQLQEIVGQNLAWALFGGVKHFVGGKQTATENFILKNAEKYGDVADRIVTRQLVGDEGQKAIEDAINQARKRQSLNPIVKPKEPKVEAENETTPQSEQSPQPTPPPGENQVNAPSALPSEQSVAPVEPAAVETQAGTPLPQGQNPPPAQLAPPSPPPLPPRDIPVVIQRADGTSYQAGFNGWQLFNIQGDHRESLSKLNADGTGWTTGAGLEPGETIVSGDIPPKPAPAPLTKPSGAPTVLPAASETGTVGTARQTIAGAPEGGKAPIAPDSGSNVTADTGAIPVRDAAGSFPQAKSPSGITEADGLLFKIVGDIGKVPIFMPDGQWVSRFRKLRQDYRTAGGFAGMSPAARQQYRKMLEILPRNYEDDYGVNGESALAAYKAAKEAGIASELFERVKDGRNMRLDVILDQTGHKNGQELFQDIYRLSKAHSEVKQGAEQKEATRAEQEFERFNRDSKMRYKGSIELPSDEIYVGSRFTIKGAKFKVTDVELDEDGRLLSVQLDDGNRYGTQRVYGEDINRIRIDKDSLSHPENAGSTDFLTEADTEPSTGQVIPKIEGVPPETVAKGIRVEANDHPKVADQAPNLLPEIAKDELRLDKKAYDKDSDPAPESKAPSPQSAPVEAPVGSTVYNYVKHTDGRWYKTEEDGTLALKENGKPKRIPANKSQSAKFEVAAKAPAAPPDTRSPLEILDQAKQVKVTAPSGATVVRITTANGKRAQIWLKDFKDFNPANGAGAVKIEAGFVNKSNAFEPIAGDVKIEAVKKPAPNLGNGLPAGKGASPDEVRQMVHGVDTAGFSVEYISKDQAEAITGMPEARGYGGFFYNGKIYLVHENIGRGQPEGARALLREEVGHGLLRTPEGLRRLQELRDAGKLELTPAEREALLAKGYHEENLLDEFIAKSAMENQPWWQRAVETIRTWLAKAGLVELSNAETARLLLKQVRAGNDVAATAATTSEGAPAPGEPLFNIPEGLRRALSMVANSRDVALKGDDAKIRQDLSEFTDGKSVFHETSLENSIGVYGGLMRPFKQSWTQFMVSDNPDLALGQSGKGVLFELSPYRINGTRVQKPGTTDRTGYEYSIDRTIQKSVQAITFAGRRQLDAFKKRYPNSLNYGGATETERGIRVPTIYSDEYSKGVYPGEPVPPAEESAPIEEAPTQVAGEKIGVFRPIEKIKAIRDRVKTGYFDGAQPVSPERSQSAWELARRFTDPARRASFAEEVANSGQGQMAPGLLRNELWEYAVRMALNKDPRLLEFMTLRSQEFQTIAPELYTAFNVGGDSQAGLVLRAAAERANQGLWKRITAYTKEQLNFLGMRLSKGPNGIREIITAIDDLMAITTPEDLETAIRTGKDKNGRTVQDILDMGSEERKAAEAVSAMIPEKRATILETVYEWMKSPVDRDGQSKFVAGLKAALMELRLTDEQAQTIADATWNRKITVDGVKRRRLWDAELTRLDELAEKTANAFIDRVEATEWKKPESPNEVRDIIRDALRSKEARDMDPNNLLGFKADLKQKLITAGLSERTAQKLSDAIVQKRETDLINANVRARERASESKNIRSLIEALRTTPYLAQSDPKWRRETAENWFKSNGLSAEQSRVAAKMFDEQFVKAMMAAVEREVNRLTKNGTITEPRTIPELITAIRLGLTDPKVNWVDSLAKKYGFTPLTEEQHARLADLEQQLSDPKISTPEQVALVEQMMGIMRHVGDSNGHMMKFLGESFAASLLSGVRTITLHLFQPMVNTVASLAAHSAFEPRDIPSLTRALLMAGKMWWPELKYAWQKDAYSFNSEQMGLFHNELKRQFEIAQREFKEGKYLKAIPRITFAWQQYVIRALQSANQAGMAVVQKWKLALYGSLALRQSGFGTADVSNLVDSMIKAREAEYEDAIARGFDKNTAEVIANSAMTDRAESILGAKLGNMDKATKAREAAIYDAFSVVGRRAPKIGEMDEGMLSRPVNWFMRHVSEARREGGAPSMLTIMAVGFMNVPFRLTRYYAGWSPYGLIRWGANRYLQAHANVPWVKRITNEKGTFWNQSYKNEIAAQARLREALIGTGLMLGFVGWQATKHTSDDDAEKRPFAMYATGAGPENRTLRDAWLKRGYQPFSLNVVVGGKVVARMPITRVGEVLAYPLGMAAALDDLAWKRKQEKATGNDKEFIGRDALAGLSTYYEIIGAQGVLQAAGHLSQLGRGESGVGRAMLVSAAGAASSAIVPGKQALQSLTDAIWGPIDRSSAEAAAMANFPVLNALWNGQALNRFGDTVGDHSWSAVIGKMGIPIVFRVADTPQNRDLYQTILNAGAAPPDIRRYIVEENFGPLTQEQWNKYVKISGDTLKTMALDSLDSLKTMPPQAVREFLVKAGEAANATAAAQLNLEPIKQNATGPSGGGVAAAPSGGGMMTLPGGAGVAGGGAARISLPGGVSTPRTAVAGGGAGSGGVRPGMGMATGTGVGRGMSIGRIRQGGISQNSGLTRALGGQRQAIPRMASVRARGFVKGRLRAAASVRRRGIGVRSRKMRA